MVENSKLETENLGRRESCSRARFASADDTAEQRSMENALPMMIEEEIQNM